LILIHIIYIFPFFPNKIFPLVTKLDDIISSIFFTFYGIGYVAIIS
jgi:hypothetical protein